MLQSRWAAKLLRLQIVGIHLVKQSCISAGISKFITKYCP